MQGLLHCLTIIRIFDTQRIYTVLLDKGIIFAELGITKSTKTPSSGRQKDSSVTSALDGTLFPVIVTVVTLLGVLGAIWGLACFP